MDYTGHEIPYAALEYITGSLLAEAGIAASKSGRMLWSGGDVKDFDKIASAYATKNGLKTLEQTHIGKLLDTIEGVAKKIYGEDEAKKLLRPLWNKASARFVRGADGTIHALLNLDGIREESTFMRIEYELAKEKGINIIYHF